MKKRLQSAAGAAAEALLEAARSRAPVDTGRLAASGKQTSVGKRAEVRFTAPYAAAVHRRTRPFLADAAHSPATRSAMLRAMQKKLKF